MNQQSLVATNRAFYDALWSRAHLERPNRFNTWPLISGLLSDAPARLEIGPGLRPRLPIPGTHFLDISAPAIERLNARGETRSRAKSPRCHIVTANSTWSAPLMSLSTPKTTNRCSGN